MVRLEIPLSSKGGINLGGEHKRLVYILYTEEFSHAILKVSHVKVSDNLREPVFKAPSFYTGFPTIQELAYHSQPTVAVAVRLSRPQEIFVKSLPTIYTAPTLSIKPLPNLRPMSPVTP